MKICAALVLVMVLAGCSPEIETAQPLFAPEDEKGAPPLRDGVWLIGEVDPANCSFDVDADVRQWPECAQWEILRDHQRYRYTAPAEENAGPGWLTDGFQLVGGFPVIMQDPNWDADGFNYAALVNLETDEAGVAIAFAKTPLRCPARPDGAQTTETQCGADRESIKALATTRAGEVLSAQDQNHATVEVVAYRWVRAANAGEAPP